MPELNEFSATLVVPRIPTLVVTVSDGEQA
jgi:hypothetical protein